MCSCFLVPLPQDRAVVGEGCAEAGLRYVIAEVGPKAADTPTIRRYFGLEGLYTHFYSTRIPPNINLVSCWYLSDEKISQHRERYPN